MYIFVCNTWQDFSRLIMCAIDFSQSVLDHKWCEKSVVIGYAKSASQKQQQ
jgi:hypothetical protein